MFRNENKAACVCLCDSVFLCSGSCLRVVGFSVLGHLAHSPGEDFLQEVHRRVRLMVRVRNRDTRDRGMRVFLGAATGRFKWNGIRRNLGLLFASSCMSLSGKLLRIWIASNGRRSVGRTDDWMGLSVVVVGSSDELKRLFYDPCCSSLILANAPGRQLRFSIVLAALCWRKFMRLCSAGLPYEAETG